MTKVSRTSRPSKMPVLAMFKTYSHHMAVAYVIEVRFFSGLPKTVCSNQRHS